MAPPFPPSKATLLEKELRKVVEAILRSRGRGINVAISMSIDPPSPI
jgi:hypothetical protein